MKLRRFAISDRAPENFAAHARSRHMNQSVWTCLVAITAALAGCTSAPAPRVVRVNDVQAVAGLAQGQPLIIEFHEGDTLPLDFSLQGPLLESDKEAPPIVLTARRRFFLRLDGDGLSASLDGEDFSRRPLAPGSFQIGIGATPESGTRANLTIKGPTPQELSPQGENTR